MKAKRIFMSTGVLMMLVGLGIGLYVWQKYKHLSIPRKEDQVQQMATDGLFTYPKGYEFVEFATGIKGARTIIEDPKGRLLVAQMSEGKVLTLSDSNNDNKAETKTLIVGLKLPHGMALRCGHGEDYVIKSDCVLYVAAQEELYMYPYYPETGAVGKQELQLQLPGGLAGHKTRSLLFLPTEKGDKLLISVGSSCNVCEEDDTRKSSVLIFDTTSGKSGYYSTGLRNAVFMALHPITKKVYVTEMGRDGLGDDTPPDELNILEEGGFFGWPWFYGKNVADMTFKAESRPSFKEDPIKSAVDLQAHSAPLGIAFIPNDTSWDESYRLNAIVAYHGSWNRSAPTGYKLVRVIFDRDGNYLDTKDFITGWLQPNKKTIGRPAGVLVAKNGHLYVTDDQAGKVYVLKQK